MWIIFETNIIIILVLLLKLINNKILFKLIKNQFLYAINLINKVKYLYLNKKEWIKFTTKKINCNFKILIKNKCRKILKK